MTDESIRASDNDREKFVAALREAYTEGRLTLDEFEERTSVAYAARTWGELRVLTEDLPAPPVLSVQQLGAGTGSSTGSGTPVPDSEARRALDGADQRMSGMPPMSRVSPDLMRTAPRRPRPFGRLLPVVFIWALIAAAAGASHLAVVLAVVFVAALGIRSLGGGRW